MHRAAIRKPRSGFQGQDPASRLPGGEKRRPVVRLSWTARQEAGAAAMGHPGSARRREERRCLRNFMLQLAPGDGELRRSDAHVLSSLAHLEAQRDEGFRALSLPEIEQDRFRTGRKSELGRHSETACICRRRRARGGPAPPEFSTYPVWPRAVRLYARFCLCL